MKNGTATEEITATRLARIGLVLMGYRRATGLMQNELAEEIGINPATLSHLEGGTGNASGETITKILYWMLSAEEEGRGIR